MVEEKKETPKKVDPEKLAETIANATIVDLNSTAKILEEKYGISIQAPVAAAPVASVSAEATAGEEAKSSYSIELKAVGEKKIEVIKVVRDITQKGLKEAKDLVDAAASGSQVVKENVKKEEAEEIKKKLEAAGAKVELK